MTSVTVGGRWAWFGLSGGVAGARVVLEGVAAAVVVVGVG